MTDRRRHNSPPRRHNRTRQITPRPHWLLLSVLAVTLSTAVLLQGYTHHMFGLASDTVTGARGHNGTVPSQVVHGGPVIANAATSPHTAQVKAHTIALTFDDGPDPVWTPRILEVLRRNHVHATFFVVGSQVVSHPELVHLMMGLYAFRLDGERPGPLWSLPLRQFAYRQLMYQVVIQSVFTAVSGSRLRWQRMERYGSLQAPVGAEAPRNDVSPQGPGFSQPTPYDGVPQPPPHNGFRQPAPHETPQSY